MNCEKCGKEIPEGMTECEACKVEAEEVKTEAVTEETEVAATEIETEFAEPSFEEEPQKAKKGKKGILIGGISGLIAIVLAVLLAFNFSFAQGVWLSTFGSEEDYFAFIIKKELSESVNSFTDIYGKILENYDIDKGGTEGKLEINISDEAMVFLKEALPEGLDIDLDDFKNISLDISTVLDGNKQLAQMGLNLGENHIIDFSTIIDMDGKDMYLGLPGLTDKHLLIEDAITTDETNPLANLDIEKLVNALPDDEKLNKILDKYIEIALDNFGNVVKKSDTLTIGDYSQKVTVLEKKITEKDLANVAKAVLKELKGDDDVKDIFEDIEAFALEEYADLLEENEYEKGDLYKDFKEAVIEAIDDINESELSTDEMATFILYVNSKHEIIGAQIEKNDEVEAKYATVYSGDNFVFEAEVTSENLKITGEGTNKKDLMNATFKVKVDKKNVVEIDVKDFDIADMKDGKLNGSIAVKPTMETISNADGMTGGAASILSMLEPAFKISFESTDTEGKVTFAIVSKDKNFIGMTVSAKTTKGEEVKIPANAISSDKATEWANTIDLNKLLTNIKKLNLPAEITDALDMYVEYINEVGGLGNFIVEMNSAPDENYGDYDDYYGDEEYYSEY